MAWIAFLRTVFFLSHRTGSGWLVQLRPDLRLYGSVFGDARKGCGGCSFRRPEGHGLFLKAGFLFHAVGSALRFCWRSLWASTGCSFRPKAQPLVGQVDPLFLHAGDFSTPNFIVGLMIDHAAGDAAAPDPDCPVTWRDASILQWFSPVFVLSGNDGQCHTA